MAIDLSIIESEELIDRYNKLISEYVYKSLKLADELESFGRMKNELQLIVIELTKRGKVPEIKQELEDLITEKMEKIKKEEENNNINESQTNNK